jgi:hypothetical protein
MNLADRFFNGLYTARAGVDPPVTSKPAAREVWQLASTVTKLNKEERVMSFMAAWNICRAASSEASAPLGAPVNAMAQKPLKDSPQSASHSALVVTVANEAGGAEEEAEAERSGCSEEEEGAPAPFSLEAHPVESNIKT